MKTPNTRAEFERNFHLLHHHEQLGKIHIAENVTHALEGLERVRALPNGRIDFLSVDEMARLQANMMADMMSFVPEEKRSQSGKAEPGTDTEERREEAVDQPSSE